jgi:homoserine kinase
MNCNYLIQVPSSTSNLGPGYDTLGLALKLYLRVEVGLSSSSRTISFFEGEGENDLPAFEQTLIYRVMRHVFFQEGQPLPGIELRITNQIPIARGLGSSASSIVAGLAIFEALTGKELSQEKFYRYALNFEKHPDNLTSCRFGGFTISCVDEKHQVAFFRSNVSPELKLLAVVPNFKLSTRKARAVVSSRVRIQDAVFNLQRSSLLVAALLRDEFQLLSCGLKDQLHQPFRAPLIPGFEEILKLNEAGLAGLWALCLSGAGPSVLAFAHSNLDGIFEAVRSIFARNGISCRRFDLEVDNLGRTIQPLSSWGCRPKQLEPIPPLNEVEKT